MVAVMVDGPLRQHHIGLLRSEQPAESLIMRVIDNGPSIVLAGETGPRSKALAGLLGFAGADSGTAIKARPAAKPLAAIQVQQNYFMAEIGEQRDSPCAASFRIARVPARHNDLQRRCLEQRQCSQESATRDRYHIYFFW
jgi:hypothetical protein